MLHRHLDEAADCGLAHRFDGFIDFSAQCGSLYDHGAGSCFDAAVSGRGQYPGQQAGGADPAGDRLGRGYRRLWLAAWRCGQPGSDQLSGEADGAGVYVYRLGSALSAVFGSGAAAQSAFSFSSAAAGQTAGGQQRIFYRDVRPAGSNTFRRKNQPGAVCSGNVAGFYPAAVCRMAAGAEACVCVFDHRTDGLYL